MPTRNKKRYIPPAPVPCVCGAIHRTHIEALAPSGEHAPLELDVIEDHKLIALDAVGQLCSCGACHSSHVEHLADVVLGQMAAAA